MDASDATPDARVADATGWLDALTPAARQAVELAALWPRQVPATAVVALLSVSPQRVSGCPRNSRGLRELLAGFDRPVLRELRDGAFEWIEPCLRRHALQSFRRSGRATAWADGVRALAAGSSRSYRLDETTRGLLRAALLGGCSEHAARAAFGYAIAYCVPAEPLARALELLLGGAELDGFHSGLRPALLRQMLAAQLQRPSAAAADWCRRALGHAALAESLAPLLAEHALLAGQPEWLPSDRGTHALYTAALASLDAAGAGDALAAFARAIEQMPRDRGQRRMIPHGWAGLLYAMALVIAEPAPQRRLQQVFKRYQREFDLPCTTAINALKAWHEECQAGRAWQPPQDLGLADDAASAWTLAVLYRWSGRQPEAGLGQSLRAVAEAMQAAGWQRIAADIVDLLEHRPARGVAGWQTPEPAWQGVLRSLQRLAGDGAAGDSAAPRGSRLRAVVSLFGGDSQRARVELYEQRATKSGGYTIGRSLTGARDLPQVSDRLPADATHEHRLLQAWHASIRDRYDIYVSLDLPLFAALVGHPQVALREGGRERPVRVERGTPRLSIERLEDGCLRLALQPSLPESGRRRLEVQGDRILLTDFDDGHLRLQNALAEQAELPAEALPELLALAPNLTGKIELATEFGAAEIIADTDPRIHVLIEPLAEGLRFALRVRPLGADGVYVVPALGAAELLGLRDGLPLRGRRRLDAERAALERLIEHCPLLAGGEHGEPVDLVDPEAALELLGALTALGNAIGLAWPAGRAWRLGRQRSGKALRLSLRRQRDWFAAEGGVALDDGSVVELASLLEHLPSSQSRFVRLGDDRIIALSQQLARQLRLLRALGELERGGIRLPAQAAALLQPLLDEADEAELDRAFRQQLERIAASEAAEPALPAGLAAELRDYQRDGYRWLMRLAGWGAGALLADDMGLGKTVQALAMLAARSAEGPALVVAPTSVIGNWRAEARRFTPGLAVQIYGDGERRATLAALGPGSLLLASYGLLAADIDAFADCRFASLVLDEAQAIKNPATRRAQAVRRLQADFRVAMTGTPIENHLGELWSLMRVLNPGLLGSRERFGKRFVAPIEREPRAPERELLRRLIAPFLLRRLKSQVLDELPPRTEIVLRIEPDADEAKLLAALRRQALEGLAGDDAPPDAKRFHVLAALTRLRRAACHPGLVAPELGLPGAKLGRLVELVEELRDNRHRALVFSQFVDYLSLVRQAFDAAGISYQYLDGSTAARARDAAVGAFQAGDGDVFLLSLKAGGVGLNLTAADYVIHLDPWWNPAVEQQATDRAHRIGQSRPVTVYKLVVAGSIEEQILALHGAKRELVDAVLEDHDQPQRIGVDELIALLADD
jgi:superfamily II DNA or RNA helicase